MSRRIDIELTSAIDDATFTWRAAGAKQPKGVVSASVLPENAKVGDELKVEVEQTIDGIEVQSVVGERQRTDKNESLELLPSEREFRPVVETRVPGKRGRDGDRRGRGRGDRDRSRDDRPRGDRDRNDRSRGDRSRGDGSRGDRSRGDRDGRRRDGGPRHAPPPELPKRPKPKRLRPGKTHRTHVLNELPAEQRPIAEVALQGMSAVRQRLAEENAKAAEAGRPTMPEASVLKMAEDLLPRLRVAEWRDRAEAAQQQMATLDLRDLRSVVAAAADPVVARDESTRALADELKAALNAKQEEELHLWFSDIDAALAVGRVIRALRLSAQPPKAGLPFPVDIAQRLTASVKAALTPVESSDRWVATLEAAAFSPVHASVEPLGVPATVTDELTKTVTRLGPALPQVAAAFGVEVDPTAPLPKPLRPDYSKRRKEAATKTAGRNADKNETDKRETGKNGPGKREPNKHEPNKHETGKRETGKNDAGQSDDRSDTDRTAGSDTSADDPAGSDPAASDAPAPDATPAPDAAPADDGSESQMPVIEADIVEGGPQPGDTEAELIAEAEVVSEADALTTAAAEIEAEGGSIDDQDAVDERARDLISEESNAQDQEVTERLQASDDTTAGPEESDDTSDS